MSNLILLKKGKQDDAETKEAVPYFSVISNLIISN